jgi:hypothetical protein
MSFVIAAGPSLLAKIRGLLGLRARALFLGVCLGVGALSGMPIRPEEIEKHMRCMSKAEVVQLLENERQPSGDPPESESAVHSTVSTS